MRMWMVPPKLLCRHHLLGEHVEIHMLVGCLKRGYSIAGYLKKRLVDPQKIRQRHEELVREMKARGFRHNSPILPPKTKLKGIIQKEENMRELERRCRECRKKIRA